MADLENNEYLDENQEEISTEELADLRNKAERLEKAEKAIVELKRSSKKQPEIDLDTLLEEKLAKRSRDEAEKSFFDKNKDLEEFKDSISTYVNKGLSFDEAKHLVTTRDETYLNRSKTNSMNLTDGDMAEKSVYSEKDLENMSQSAYNKAMERVESGKARIS